MRPTIEELMSIIHCEKWPERWRDIYDFVMDKYDKYGCEYATVEFYERISTKYNILKEYGHFYKEAAEKIAKNENLSRALALVCEVAKDRENAHQDFAQFSLPLHPEGKRAIEYDMFPALVMCATVDYTYSLLASRNLPSKYINDAMNMPNIMIKSFMARNSGAPGAISWTWYQKTVVEANLFRIGRLELELNTHFYSNAIVFKKIGSHAEYVTLAEDQIFHKSGHVLGSKFFEDDVDSWIANVEETESSWIGFPYDENGYVKPEKIELLKSKWEKYIQPNDLTVGIHIPDGGGLTPELVSQSFEEMKKFLETYFPDYPYKAFQCKSWLMDYQLIKLLGEQTNISRFISRFTPLTCKSAGKDVFNFIFLKNNTDNIIIEDLPENTSLERKIKQHYLEGKAIYECFGYIPKDKI